MIAGTYTPLIIAFADDEGVRMERQDRLWMLSGIWLLALVGSVFKYFFPSRFRIVSMLIYVAT